MTVRRLRTRKTALALAATALLAGGASPASAATCTWKTGSGNWDALVNWVGCVTGNGNPTGVPGGADTAVIGAGNTVTVSTSQAILTLNNAGVVNVNNAVAFSLDARTSGASFTGGGQLVLGGSGSRLYVEGGNGVTVSAGSTIRGAGQIGQAVQQTGSSLFSNAGTISADSNGELLILLNPANGGSYANSRLMEARNGGTLDLRSTFAQTASGQIRAENGSFVLLNDADINGGVVGSSGSGRIRSSNNFNNVLTNVTLAGVVDLASSASQLRILNGLTFSNGSIDIGNSTLYLDNRGNLTQSLGGTGSINLAGGSLRMEGTGQTTTGANVTIRGHGTVGQATNQTGQYTWISNGLVSADTSGQTLNLVAPGNGSVPIQNSGILEAINGGRLLLSADVDATPSSQVRAGAGSVIEMNGVRVTGTVNTTGTGSFRANGNFNNVLSGVTLNGNLDMASLAASTRVSEGLVLNGTIDVGGSSTLYLDNRSTPNQILSGTGNINLDGGSLRMEGTGQTTTGANVAIRGHGTVGQATLLSGQHTWVHNGLVSADVSGQTLNLVPVGNLSQPIQNSGILEAINGGRLLLSADVDAAPSSQVRAGAGSVIEMNGVRVTGTVNTTGTGSFRANGNFNNVLSGVTLNGNLDMASLAASTRVSEGLVLNGAIDVGSSSTLYLDNRSTPNQTLSGTGSINLAGGALRMERTGQTTTGANVAIRGHGTVGQATLLSGQHTWVHNGLVSADVSGQTLNLVPPGNGSQAIQHNGTMRATGGGTLQIGSNVVGGAGSRYDVDAASRIVMNGVTLSGVVNQTGSGAITASNSLNNVLNAAALSGRVELRQADSGRLRITGGLDMVAGSSITAFGGRELHVDNTSNANQAITGNGTINLAGGFLRFEGTGQTTIASGVTIRGEGSIGSASITSGQHALINNGTIRADSAPFTLNVVPIANGTVGITGTGTLEVAGGTLNLATGQATAQGRLDIGASGSLGLGTQNLTLSADYTNAQAGSGNGFNRRAGVTGAGQILAGGDAAQVLSGAQVTGGATSNATLTIGNVRVGASTFDVTIGNGGSTGPTLRGALQTTVNGASITDARLSGSGVTASNYNAGGPAGAGEVRAITFMANSAGALAPMGGQVINLRSNFENIADQKLNIVLGNGAAAYNAAVGATNAPVQVANQRVGGNNTATLAISNTAASGAFSEDLNVSVAGTGGHATASGSINGRLAGSGNTGSGAVTVGVDASSAGAKTGAVNLAYQSAGAVNGVSNGLGVLGVGGQTVMVTGNVYQTAAGQLQGSALNFGTLQVGQQISQNLVVRNTASGPAGFVEDLNASFGAAGNSQISGSGSLAGITASSSSTGSNGTMTVTVTGSTAGVLNSGIAVNYFSAGAVGGVSNGLGVVGVGSETFTVNGSISAVANVINQASPLVNTPNIDLGAVRVGAAAPTAQVSVSNLATAEPQAALNASIASAGAPVTASGSFSGLAPGATSTALQVGLNTAVAGNFTGANAGKATVAFVSDASNVGGCAPNCQLTLGSLDVTVSGKVYTAAVGQLATPVVDFGIVRVGDTVSARNITVSNTAAETALNDTLHASLSGVNGAFVAGTPATGVAAQASGQISVTLNTSSAGVYAQSGTVSFLSQNPDMADTGAGPDAGVQVQAQVNNLANADFDLLTGLGQLSDLGNGSFLLDLGQLTLGSSGNWLLQIDNEVGGPADALRGLFDLSGVNDFLLGGFGDVSGLEAGQAQGGLAIDFSATQLGSFQDEVTFRGFSYNASDPDGMVQDRRLLIRASVVDPNGGGGSVPEPGTLALLLVAALASRRALRRAARH